MKKIGILILLSLINIFIADASENMRDSAEVRRYIRQTLLSRYTSGFISDNFLQIEIWEQTRGLRESEGIGDELKRYLIKKTVAQHGTPRPQSIFPKPTFGTLRRIINRASVSGYPPRIPCPYFSKPAPGEETTRMKGLWDPKGITRSDLPRAIFERSRIDPPEAEKFFENFRKNLYANPNTVLIIENYDIFGYFNDEIWRYKRDLYYDIVVQQEDPALFESILRASTCVDAGQRQMLDLIDEAEQRIPVLLVNTKKRTNDRYPRGNGESLVSYGLRMLGFDFSRREIITDGRPVWRSIVIHCQKRGINFQNVVYLSSDSPYFSSLQAEQKALSPETTLIGMSYPFDRDFGDFMEWPGHCNLPLNNDNSEYLIKWQIDNYRRTGLWFHDEKAQSMIITNEIQLRFPTFQMTPPDLIEQICELTRSGLLVLNLQRDRVRRAVLNWSPVKLPINYDLELSPSAYGNSILSYAKFMQTKANGDTNMDTCYSQIQLDAIRKLCMKPGSWLVLDFNVFKSHPNLELNEDLIPENELFRQSFDKESRQIDFFGWAIHVDPCVIDFMQDLRIKIPLFCVIHKDRRLDDSVALRLVKGMFNVLGLGWNSPEIRRGEITGQRMEREREYEYYLRQQMYLDKRDKMFEFAYKVSGVEYDDFRQTVIRDHETLLNPRDAVADGVIVTQEGKEIDILMNIISRSRGNPRRIVYMGNNANLIERFRVAIIKRNIKYDKNTDFIGIERKQ